MPEQKRGKRVHPDHYYVICRQVVSAMRGQAGQVFDQTGFQRHFRTAAALFEIRTGSAAYQVHYSIIVRMVRQRLARMKPTS